MESSLVVQRLIALEQNITKERLKREAWSVSEVAARYGLSDGFVRLELKRGNLRGKFVGRRVIILERDIAEWVSRA